MSLSNALRKDPLQEALTPLTESQRMLEDC